MKMSVVDPMETARLLTDNDLEAIYFAIDCILQEYSVGPDTVALDDDERDSLFVLIDILKRCGRDITPYKPYLDRANPEVGENQ
jgi:hypothetical protein